ncbi:hypothetical protein JDW19_09820 [Paenibacillus polymyxa]|uniref:Uncharacterized protein n=1 Tax=Paenibacillus polymyxa TaxID=1406 RepID=A0A8I1LQ90_PAEPO|nr:MULTISPECIES: hypothetical protein [Paenibacillus]KAF6575918.1 hypothetical protein G9G53_05830 [Paenibacillus sp. EKM206P]KAF6589551.1 hypothetical protein G9G52_09715 [Paenibacillus sp. EKM205P]MBM0633429.1 hypothetical protein [Paenibacillus polymyxa]
MSIQTFDSLEALVHAVDQTEINEWVFANLKHVQSNPLNSTYYIIPEEELWELEMLLWNKRLQQLFYLRDSLLQAVF